MGTGDSFTRGKATEREADYSPPRSTEFKNAWSYISTPPYVLMEWYVDKHRDHFTLTFNRI